MQCPRTLGAAGAAADAAFLTTNSPCILTLAALGFGAGLASGLVFFVVVSVPVLLMDVERSQLQPDCGGCGIWLSIAAG